MLVALMADMHANRQAFEACLEHARASGAERYVFLGDFVGYGADPSWCVATAMQYIEAGALAVKGNHDNAVNNDDERLNFEAQVSISWTRGQLGVGERKFLADLPITIEEDGRLFVHGDASDPARWNYVSSVDEAARSLRSTKAQTTFCGHLHRPCIYSMTALAKMTVFTPVTDVAVPLQGLRRWVVVLGSVGQPRDSIPAASYAMLDTHKNEITFLRVPYDIEGAANAIKNACLPQFLAERLFIGR